MNRFLILIITLAIMSCGDRTLVGMSSSKSSSSDTVHKASSYSSTSSSEISAYYESATGKNGAQLKETLHNIIKNHHVLPYTSSQPDVWDAIKDLDENPNNTNNVILIYTRRSQAKTYSQEGGIDMSADAWNREHVWAKSRGFPDEKSGSYTYPAYTDVHHLRAADASVNSTRNNNQFDNGGIYDLKATQCKCNSDVSWEPADEIKGDIARIMFYMDVRYAGATNTINGITYAEPDLILVD